MVAALADSWVLLLVGSSRLSTKGTWCQLMQGEPLAHDGAHVALTGACKSNRGAHRRTVEMVAALADPWVLLLVGSSRLSTKGTWCQLCRANHSRMMVLMLLSLSTHQSALRVRSPLLTAATLQLQVCHCSSS